MIVARSREPSFLAVGKRTIASTKMVLCSNFRLLLLIEGRLSFQYLIGADSGHRSLVIAAHCIPEAETWLLPADSLQAGVVDSCKVLN